MNEASSTGPEPNPPGSPIEPAINLQRILAPIDFSAASQYGLAFAGTLAGRFHARIHLVHVVEPPVLPEWGYAHLARREATLRQAAAGHLRQVPLESGIDPGLIRSADIRSGDSGNEICQAAADDQSDLIVLASHGLGGLQHAFSGSTAEHVVRGAPCPVLTVRHHALRTKVTVTPVFDLKRIVVTTDFSEASKKAFPYALALARKFEATLILVHVVPAQLSIELSLMGIAIEDDRLLEEARERLPSFRQAELDPHLRVDSVVVSGGSAHEICRTAESQGAGLIVMATHGHTGLKHFMLGSVTENVVRHAPCPVLVVREREHDFVRS